MQEENNKVNNQIPDTPGMVHKEKLKARRIAKNKKLLKAARAKNPQTLSRVTDTQLNTPRLQNTRTLSDNYIYIQVPTEYMKLLMFTMI